MLVEQAQLAAALGLREGSTKREILTELARPVVIVESHEQFQARHNAGAFRRLRASAPSVANSTRSAMDAHTRAIEAEPDRLTPGTTVSTPWLTGVQRRGMSGPAVGGDVTVPSALMSEDGLLDLARISRLSPATTIGF